MNPSAKASRSAQPVAAATETRHLVCCALGMLAVAGAAAQQPAPAPVAGTVVVKGNAEQYEPRENEPASRVVVGSAELQKYGDQTIAQALRRQSGITVISSRGTAEIRMRGLGSGYTQILLNGEPAPSGYNLEDLSPSLVERVEIMRTPTADVSSRAMAGSINIVLKTKVGAAATEVKLSGERSASHNGQSGSVQLSDKTGNSSYVIPVSVRRFHFTQHTDEVYSEALPGGAREGYTSPSVNDGLNESVTMAPRWSHTAPDRAFGLQGLISASRNTSDNAARYMETGRSMGVPLHTASDNRIDNRQARVEATYGRKNVLGGQIDVKATAGIVDRQRSGGEDLDYADGLLVRDTTQDYIERTATAVAKYLRAAGKHRYSAGAELARTWRDQTDSRFVTAPPATRRADLDLRSDMRLDRYALYAQDEWQPSPAFSLYTGLRYERLDWDIDDGVAPVVFKAGIYSPIIQALWKPAALAGYQLRAAFNRTYRPPALALLTRADRLEVNNSPANPDNVGNQRLRPEIANGIDVAIEKFAAGGAAMSLSAYVKRIGNEIGNELRNDNGRWILMPVNAGDARMHGAEFELKRRLGGVLLKTDTLDLRGSVSVNRSTTSNVKRHQAPISDQVPLSAVLSADYRRSATLMVGVLVAYRQRTATWLTDDLSLRKSGATTVDFYVNQDLGKGVTLRLNLSAPIDGENRTHFSYVGQPYGSERDLTYHNKATVRLNLDVKL